MLFTRRWTYELQTLQLLCEEPFADDLFADTYPNSPIGCRLSCLRDNWHGAGELPVDVKWDQRGGDRVRDWKEDVLQIQERHGAGGRWSFSRRMLLV